METPQILKKLKVQWRRDYEKAYNVFIGHERRLRWMVIVIKHEFCEIPDWKTWLTIESLINFRITEVHCYDFRKKTWKWRYHHKAFLGFRVQRKCPTVGVLFFILFFLRISWPLKKFFSLNGYISAPMVLSRIHFSDSTRKQSSLRCGSKCLWKNFLPLVFFRRINLKNPKLSLLNVFFSCNSSTSEQCFIVLQSAWTRSKSFFLLPRSYWNWREIFRQPKICRKLGIFGH